MTTQPRTPWTPYDYDWRRLVAWILERDGHVCHWCGGPATTGDHLVELVHGGSRLDPGNVVASCQSCNATRGARLSGTRTRTLNPSHPW